MTTKHTPGPWVALGDHYDECVRVFNGDNNQICVFRYGADPDRRVTAMATARLIAAAPELLEALRTVQTEIAKWRDGEAHMNFEDMKYCVVDAAIAKAERGAE